MNDKPDSTYYVDVSTTSTSTISSFSATSNTGDFVNLINHEIHSFSEATKNIECNFSGFVVNAVYAIDSGYIFSIEPKEMSDNKYVLGGFYKIERMTGEITGYSPVMNPEEFKNALNNPVMI